MSEDTEPKNESEPLASPDSTAQALRDEVVEAVIRPAKRRVEAAVTAIASIWASLTTATAVVAIWQSGFGEPVVIAVCAFGCALVAVMMVSVSRRYVGTERAIALHLERIQPGWKSGLAAALEQSKEGEWTAAQARLFRWVLAEHAEISAGRKAVPRLRWLSFSMWVSHAAVV